MERESKSRESNAKSGGNEIEVDEWEVSEAATVVIGYVNRDICEQE